MKKATKALALLLSALMLVTLAGCTSKAVTETQARIDAIGEVTAESQGAVEAAEAAYNALSDKDKEAVENIAVLQSAREELDSILAVRAAEQLIDAIGAVTAGSESAVEAAETAYNALSAGEREQVSNAARLPEAREELDSALAVRAAEQLIDAIGEVTAESGDAVEAAEAAYNALSEAEQAAVGNLAALRSAREELTAIIKETIQKQLLGTWTAELDGIDLLVRGFDSSFEDVGLGKVDLREYISSFVIRFNLEFRRDGTFRIFCNENQIRELGEAIREPLARLYRDIFRMAIAQELKNAGYELDLSDDSALASLLGYSSLDEMIGSAMGMSVEELVDTVVGDQFFQYFKDADTEGPYDVDESRIYFTFDSDGTPDYDTYEVYELSGDTLTFIENSGNQSEDEMLFGADLYPVVFRRMG